MRQILSIRAARTTVLAAVITIGTACSDATVGPTPAADLAGTTRIVPNVTGTTRIVLRAWEDTRVGLPPLAVTRADSIQRVVAFVQARSDGWTAVDSLPGRPLPAEFYEEDRVAQRFGILDMPGDRGFFISWDGNRALLRPATDTELYEFLGFFGIGVVFIE